QMTCSSLFLAYATLFRSLVDFGLPGETRDDVVMVDDLAPGSWVELPAVSETALYNNWAFTTSDGSTSLYTLSDTNLFKIERDTRSEEHTSELQSRENLVC